MTLKGSNKCICSRGLEDGLTLFNWLDGRKIDPYGQAHAHVSPSLRPASVKVRPISVTSGPNSDVLSASADLQRSLESRLRARMDVNGSPEYKLTWKHWDISPQVRICALRASGRRTSDKGYGGWPTPNTNPDAPNMSKTRENGRRAQRQTLQSITEIVSGWPTPNTMDSIDREGLRPSRIATGRTGGYITEILAGWPTPASKEKAGGEYKDPEKALARFTGPHSNDLRDAAQIAGWTSPKASDTNNESWEAKQARNVRHLKEGRNQGKGVGGMTLPMQANVAGWASPTVQDAENCAGPSQWRRNSWPLNVQAASGTIPSSSLAPMEKRGELNPDLPRWLMGYPVEWLLCCPEKKPTTTTE